MRNLSGFDWLTLVLAIIGGLNWGLVGLFKFNLIAAIFGDMSTITRIIYVLVGLSALYLIFASPSFVRRGREDVATR